MKKLVLVLLILSISFNCLSQITLIRKQLKELFFELDFPISKYEVRKYLRSDNYWNFTEINLNDKHDVLYGSFIQNYRLGYCKYSDERQLDFWFKKSTDQNYCIGIELRFLESEQEKAFLQLDEIINLFRPISYKIEIVGKKNLGKDTNYWMYFYSSANSFNQKKAYLTLNLKYVKFPDSAKYSLSSTYYIDHLF